MTATTTDKTEEMQQAFRAMAEGINVWAKDFSATLARVSEAFARAVPPERIIWAVIQEHNRRMDEFNGRTSD